MKLFTRGARQRWLFLPIALGTASLLRHFHLNDWKADGAYLEFGAGLLLFAALFWYERRLLEETTNNVVRRLTRQEAQKTIRNPGAQGDFDSETGPKIIAQAFITAIFEDEIELAFETLEMNFFICCMQAWVYDNKEELGVETEEEMAELIQNTITQRGETAQWSQFIDYIGTQFKEAVQDLTSETCGWAASRRLIGPTHEVIKAVPLHQGMKDGFMVDGPTLVTGAVEILVKYEEEFEGENKYRVAAFPSPSPPVQGFPPTFWVVGSVGSDIHPGIN